MSILGQKRFLFKKSLTTDSYQLITVKLNEREGRVDRNSLESGVLLQEGPMESKAWATYSPGPSHCKSGAE